MAKKSAKKAIAKKAPAKKKSATKKTVKKAPAKKAVAKKISSKKVTAKKTPVKKAGVKKAAVKKVPAKKTVAKKTAVKKTAVKKAVAKKAVAKKAAPKKIAVKKVATKKAVAEKKPAIKEIENKISEQITPAETAQSGNKQEVKTETVTPAKKEALQYNTEKKKVKTGEKKSLKSKKKKEEKPRPEAKQAAKIEGEGTAVTLVNAIIEGIHEKKGKNIIVLDLSKIQNRVSDYFVICEAESTIHVESIASSVEDEVKKNLDEKPFHTEGWENSQWILMDYVNVVVHVFQSEVREFYNLEGMWGDAEITEIS
ncbi:MAG: ribosome silencing factor [Bacteroidia bacterium]|nr:ribosome silencing factor [Bacteroidia bacterium]